MDAKRLEKYRVQPGDIVYSRRGDVERRALVREENDGWLCGTGCLRVRFGSNVVNSEYASFYLSHQASLERLLSEMDYEGLRADQADARARGICRGIGLVSMVEVTNPSPMFYGIGGAPISAQDGATVRLDAGGALHASSSITEQGQGTNTILAQIAAEVFGVDMDRVRVTTGDTDTVPYGGGTWASRGAGIGGEAVLLAANALKQQVLDVAGGILHKSGDFSGAIEHYRQALLEKPKMKSALFGMGMSHAEIDNLDKAFYYFKRMRRHNPELTKPLEAMVKLAIAAKKPKMAEIALRDEKKNNPKRVDTYIVLAKYYSSQERWQEAIDVCTECNNVDADNKEALQIKGSIEMKMKNYSDAESTFRKLAKIAPGTQSNLLIAEVLVEQGHLKKATDLLHRCLKNPKTKVKVLQTIAMVEARSRQVAKAYFVYLICQKLGKPTDATLLATNKLKKIIVSRREKAQKKAS